jgi:hypothetical protein
MSQLQRIEVGDETVTDERAVQIDGNDGNGYYGTGYELIVVLP